MDVHPVGRGDPFIRSANMTECLLCAGHSFPSWGIRNPHNLHARMGANTDQARTFQILSTLKIMYLFVFFILSCYTIFFRDGSS